MGWFRKIFGLEPRTYSVETYKCCDGHTLTRQRIEDIDVPVGDWRWGADRLLLWQYRYWCSCGTELTDGPSGGAAVNAVCEKCRINYGNLPGYWEH